MAVATVDRRVVVNSAVYTQLTAIRDLGLLPRRWSSAVDVLLQYDYQAAAEWVESNKQRFEAGLKFGFREAR